MNRSKRIKRAGNCERAGPSDLVENEDNNNNVAVSIESVAGGSRGHRLDTLTYNARGFLDVNNLTDAQIGDLYADDDDVEFGQAYDGEEDEWLPNGEVASDAETDDLVDEVDVRGSDEEMDDDDNNENEQNTDEQSTTLRPDLVYYKKIFFGKLVDPCAKPLWLVWMRSIYSSPTS